MGVEESGSYTNCTRPFCQILDDSDRRCGELRGDLEEGGRRRRRRTWRGNRRLIATRTNVSLSAQTCVTEPAPSRPLDARMFRSHMTQGQTRLKQTGLVEYKPCEAYSKLDSGMKAASARGLAVDWVGREKLRARDQQPMLEGEEKQSRNLGNLVEFVLLRQKRLSAVSTYITERGKPRCSGEK